MNDIILIGAGGHARACIEVIESGGQYKIAGLVEKDERIDEKKIGYPIIGVDEDLETLRQKYTYALVTVGQIKSPKTRIKIYKTLKKLEYQLPVVISSSAYLSKYTEIYEGTIIMHGALLNAGVEIGANCIINNMALVEHDVKIGNHCHIATGAILNGEIQVGEGTFIGSGVITKQSITIGENCVVGAGCVIKKNLYDNQMVA
jgi:sugar O-acyltransferase (sialic acid O-acetyltransferase NeuD family)